MAGDKTKKSFTQMPLYLKCRCNGIFLLFGD